MRSAAIVATLLAAFRGGAMVPAHHTATLGHPAQRPVAMVFSGRARQLDVTPPRVTADVAVDGRLDEPVWRKAALLTGFSQFSPVDGVAASDSTEVLVWYSPTAMYFGIRAYEVHGAVHPNLAARDHIDAEDRVELLLGTFNDGRQAYVFQVNPLGVQADGTLVETAQGSVMAGRGSSLTGRQAPDLSADFVWQSRGRVTPYGYEVEVRIPFKSIRYQSATTQRWGFNVTRHVQHSGFDDSWAPARRAAASFLAQSGTLDGLTDLRRGLVVDVNPEVTETTAGVRRAGGQWGYDAGHPNLGGNLRWGVTSNLTLNATVRPDFSQVEADASQLSYDPRNALYYAERRPFFLDGIEQFAVPNQLVYTRRIVQPTAAVKLTGTALGANLALLTAADDPSTSASGRVHPLFNIARVQRDIGPGTRVGALITDREDGGDYNRVADLDTRTLFGGIYTVQLQAASSVTRRAGVRTGGPLWSARFDANGRRVGLTYSLSGIDPEFETRSGFVARAGLVNANLVHRYTYLGAPRAVLQNVTGAISLLGDWQYRAFMRRQAMLDRKLHFDLNAVLRGGWTAGAGLYTEVFGYDPSLYAAYRLVVPAAGTVTPGGAPALDTVPFVGRPEIPNHDYLLSFATPQGARFAATAFLIFGQDENFYEWQQADILIANLSLDWRPTPQLRFNSTYAHQEYRRRDDGSLVAIRRIPLAKVEYQLSRPIFVRLVTEYDAQHRAPLRDDGRTNAPILLYDPSTGSYAPATSVRNNRVRFQGLFSYQPVPGTVFFAGYGALLSEPDAFRFRRFGRESDGFFLKFSYLFRAR